MAVSPSQIYVSWGSVTDSAGAVGYKLYRDGSVIADMLPTSTATTSYSDIGLSASATYTYTVTAYDTTGNESAQSNEASATTQAAPPIPTGYATCDQTIKNVPGDYPSIQQAIDASSFGDTIKVAAGTYNENLTLKSGICLEGAGIDQTIISKAGASGMTGDGVSYVIIKNLTVENSGCAPGSCAGGGDGGGILLFDSSNITLQSCRLTGNSALNGGGILVSGSSLTMDHCLIDSNTAANVGGAMVVDSTSNVSLTNVTIVNNVWSNPLRNGGVGGIRAYGSSVQMTNSILWGNVDENFSGNGSGISNSDIGGWSGGTNNVSSNPDFVSATDYHQQASSPAAGMGLY